MNVVSLELCRELYELGGWEPNFNEGFYWYTDVKDKRLKLTDENCWVEYEELYEQRKDAFGDRHRMVCPAYDLGYLLRKLPAVTKYGWLYLAPFDGELWSVYYQEGAAKPSINYRSSTPEDALCKLAMELFKQGVLQ